MQIAVLGAGAWGTALSQVAADSGHDVTLWTWLPEHAASMNQARENLEFLPGVTLGKSLKITSIVSEALEGVELIVVVVPSHAVRPTMVAARPHVPSGAKDVCASKGVEQDTLSLRTQVIAESLAEDPGEVDAQLWRVGVLSGPSFAKEVARKVPTNLVSAATDPALATLVQKTFSTPWLRVYTSTDPVGVEVAGALKNVIAIAAGACDGFGLGHNTRAALITRGIAEMGRLAHALGGKPLTTAGLAGVGDLVLTCTGDLSRNRTLGYKLGKGVSLQEALDTSAGVAEGYVTAKSAHELASRVGVELPICDAVFAVLYQGRHPSEVLQGLLSRPLRAEHE
jgi:glycerol-3-phosphate dehydrogenase (NAD(P)+)